MAEAIHPEMIMRTTGSVNLTEQDLVISVGACTVCGSLTHIRFRPSGGGPVTEIDNREFHRKWHTGGKT